MALGHDKRDRSKPSAVTNLSKETELRHNTVCPSWHKHVVVCWLAAPLTIVYANLCLNSALLQKSSPTLASRVGVDFCLTRCV